MESSGIKRAITAAGGELALAYKAGVSLAVVYKWRGIGGVLMTADAAKVSRVTGVPIADLVPTIEAKPAEPSEKRRARRRGKDKVMSSATCCDPRPLRRIGQPAALKLAS